MCYPRLGKLSKVADGVEFSMMCAMYSCPIRVRVYECDSIGHVNNAVYVQYLHQATLEAHDIHRLPQIELTPRTLSIEYQTPARYNDELQVRTWQIGVESDCLVCGYQITRVSDSASVVRAVIRWQGLAVLTESGAEETPTSLKPFQVPRDNGARPFFWKHTVRRYELGAGEIVQLAVYFNWLEEATFRTAHLIGWSMERLRAENFLTLQFRHDAEFFQPARHGDSLRLTSRLFDVRRIRGTWIHELRRTIDDTLILRDYSTGAFMDWSGNIRPAPPGFMERLMEGEMREP